MIRRGRGGVRVSPDPSTDPGAGHETIVGDAASPVTRNGDEVELEIDGRRVRAAVRQLEPVINDHAVASRLEVELDGWRFVVRVEDAAQADLRERARRGGEAMTGRDVTEIRTPIPGRIVSVDVSAGDEVEAGARVLTIEAMKMQNEVRAPRAGRIPRVDVQAGQAVEAGDVLVVIE